MHIWAIHNITNDVDIIEPNERSNSKIENKKDQLFVILKSS